MPRNKLRKAQPIVKASCKEHAIAYHETAMLQSYREILHYLHQVSAPLRKEQGDGATRSHHVLDRSQKVDRFVAEHQEVKLALLLHRYGSHFGAAQER